MVQPLAEAVGRCVAHARAPAMASAARAGPARGGMSPAAARRGRRRRAAAGQANAQASGTTSPELCPPVVDVRPLRRGAWRSAEATNTEARDRAVAEVATALENWGFYSVINHGVDEAVAARFEAAQREFFALPKEEKRRVKRTADNSRGWFDDELTKQRLDWKVIIISKTGAAGAPFCVLPACHTLTRTSRSYGRSALTLERRTGGWTLARR